MYEALTRGIRVRVVPEYSEEHSDPEASRHFWIYTIDIFNEGSAPVQLRSRHWRITDGNGKIEEVRGPGVVGEQPHIEPGATHRYSSGCALRTPSGFMGGTYQMVGQNGEYFDAVIPTFSLDLPAGRRRLN